MNSAHTYELAISKSKLKDHIESFLRAGGFIRDNEDLLSMDFKGLAIASPTATAIPLTIGVKGEERMVLKEF